MNAEERLLDAGYEGIKYFVDDSYDDALIGVSEDGRAIYDFDKMVEWLMKNTVGLIWRALNGLNLIQFVHYHIWAVMLRLLCMLLIKKILNNILTEL